MSQELPLPVNGTGPEERWEAQLLAVARALPYPPTPALVAAPRPTAAAPGARGLVTAPRRPARRALAWALAVAVAVALLGLLAVPPVRSGVIEFLRLGAVRINLGGGATPTPSATPGPTPTGARPPATATLFPSATPLASVLDLDGETTLAEARARVRLPIRLPTYPAGLGEPDAVFVQDLDGEAVVLVWLDPADPTQVVMSLHFLSSSSLVDKLLKEPPARVEFTRVNGREAYWTTGPYYIVARNGFFAQMRLVTGHVLIWFEDDVTHRLETALTMDEAVRVAEGLE